MNLPKFAENVKLPEETVVQCFRYWEEFGAVLIAEEEPFHVQFLPLRKAVGSKPRKIKPEKYAKFTAALQPLLAGRMIGTERIFGVFQRDGDVQSKAGSAPHDREILRRP